MAQQKSRLPRKNRNSLEYRPLEFRRLLSATALVELDPQDVDRTHVPFVVSGDPNGTPSATPSSIVDANSTNSAFSGVVSINPRGNGNSFICSGTLISPQHVLSAAHCFDFNDNGTADASVAQSTVIFNHTSSPVSVGIDAIDIHPNYTGFNNPSVNDDIAIVTLSQPAPSGAEIYSINRQTFTSPREIVIAGFGTSGTGVSGFTTSPSFTTRRAGFNVAGGYFFDDEGSGTREVFVFDFDGPTAATNSLGDGFSLGNDREVTIGGGDSGGPSFLFNDANNNGQVNRGELTLFGVNTFGTSFSNAPAPFFGSQGGGMVVSAYTNFIDATLAGANDPADNGPQLGPQQQIGQIGRINVDGSFRRFSFGRSYVNPIVVAGPISLNGGDPATVRIRNVTSTGFDIRVEEFDYLDRTHVFESVSVMVIEAGTYHLQDGTLLEAGSRSSINHANSRINFAGSFTARPVVLAQVTTQNGAATVTPRLQAVNRNSFKIRVQEQESFDNIHIGESISYVAIQRGRGTANGLSFDAQLTPVEISHQNSTIEFRENIGNTGAFFGNIQTTRGADPVTLRYRTLNGSRATIFAQEERSADNETFHAEERVGYLAIETGSLIGRRVLNTGQASQPLQLNTRVDHTLRDFSAFLASTSSQQLVFDSTAARTPSLQNLLPSSISIDLAESAENLALTDSLFDELSDRSDFFSLDNLETTISSPHLDQAQSDWDLWLTDWI